MLLQHRLVDCCAAEPPVAVDCLTVDRRRRPIHLIVLLPRPNPTQEFGCVVFSYPMTNNNIPFTQCTVTNKSGLIGIGGESGRCLDEEVQVFCFSHRYIRIATYYTGGERETDREPEARVFRK